jgi:hypothetical protein
MLYVLQHLNTIETFYRQQKATTSTGSINALHCDDMLMQVKMMRENYNKTK